MSKENFVVMALAGASGVVVQASGWAPVNRTAFLEPLPVSVYDNTGTIVNSFGGGAGSIAGLQSGPMVIISGGIVGLSGLQVVASVTTTLAGLQSGTMVLISGGQGAISGVNVVISGGGSPNISGGVTVSGSVQVSGFVGVLSGGTIPVSIVSGSVAALSGLSITGGGNPNISGGVTVSGSVQVSGTVAVSGIIQVGSGNIIVLSGVIAPRKFHTYSASTTWGGSAPYWIAALLISGTPASQSGLTAELLRFEVAIYTSSPAANMIRLGGIQTSGVSGNATSDWDFNMPNNVNSVVIPLDNAGATLSGSTAGGTALRLALASNPSNVMTNYIYDFRQENAHGPLFSSGYGIALILVSGMGTGTYGFTWVERYLS